MAAGVVIPFWLERPPEEALQVAALAEDLGYPELWIGEMLHFDAFALAGAIAALTKRITITVGPLAIALRDPVLLAMGVASIAVLGNRPARLAIGASTPAVVERWHGRIWGQEADRIEDAVTLIRAVLGGKRTAHNGPHFRSDGFHSALGINTAHVSVAGLGPRMLAAAGRAADRVVLNLVPPQFVAQVVEQMRCPVAVWVAAAVDPAEEGWRQLSRQAALYMGAPGYRDVLRGAGLTELVDAAALGTPVTQLADRITPANLETVMAVGDVNRVRTAIAAYERSGAEVMVVPVTAGDAGGVRTLEALAPTYL